MDNLSSEIRRVSLLLQHSSTHLLNFKHILNP